MTELTLKQTFEKYSMAIKFIMFAYSYALEYPDENGAGINLDEKFTETDMVLSIELLKNLGIDVKLHIDRPKKFAIEFKEKPSRLTENFDNVAALYLAMKAIYKE